MKIGLHGFQQTRNARKDELLQEITDLSTWWQTQVSKSDLNFWFSGPAQKNLLCFFGHPGRLRVNGFSQRVGPLHRFAPLDCFEPALEVR